MKENLEQYGTSLIIGRNDAKIKFYRNEYNTFTDIQEDWQDEKLKQLMIKFNNNVASIWDDKQYNNEDNCKSNIWSSTCWSSPSPSPKLRSDSDSSTGHSEAFKQESCKINNGFSGFWEPLGNLPSLGFTVPPPIGNNFSANNWLGTKTSEERPRVNKTSLLNHQVDSLFVEVCSKAPKKEKIEISFAQPASKESSTSINKSEENLLTSPKTHFIPITTDPLENDLEETFEADAEVSRLLPCSTKCPNNEIKEKFTTQISRPRPLSTSLPELSSFMGPFEELDANESDQYSDSEDEVYFNSPATAKNETSFGRDDVSSCKEDSTYQSCPDDNEFDELFTLLNQALSDKNRNEDNSLKNVASNSLWDWCEEDEELIKKEKRLSWSCYWDTYQTESPNFKNSDKVQTLSNIDSLPEKSETSEPQIYKGVNYCQSKEALDLDLNYTNELDRGVFAEVKSNWLNEDYYNYNNSSKSDDFETLIEWSNGDEFGCNIAATGEPVDPGQIYYSWNLEEEWQREESADNCFNLRGNNKIESHVNIKRPCSFFLEGNCRKIDCKFSHDLKNITCKFWEESSCFKGELCPFLHGYPDYELDTKNFETTDPKYTIESESDFPSLAANGIGKNIDVQSNWKNDKKENQVIFRVVKKKRRKGSQQNHDEKTL